MAASKGIGSKIIYAILFGIVGYILGLLLANTGIFPQLAWENIGLFVGILFGAFKDLIE